MAKTHVLGMSASDYAATQKEYTARLEEDRIHNDVKNKLDAFCGHLTSSFYEVFHVSGAVDIHTADGLFYDGLRYNPGPARHIQEVLAFQVTSGSGGWTRVDVQMKAGIPTANESLFSAAANKPVFSASDGDGYVFKSSTFAPGSSSWAAGKFLGVHLDETVTALGTELTVMVKWKPSASYA